MSCKDCIHCSACMHTRTATLDPYQSRPTNKDTGECSDWLTTDVQEVKYGYWIEKELDNFRKVECSCSICGWSGVENYDSYVDIHDFEFCPNCGAKMDLEYNI